VKSKKNQQLDDNPEFSNEIILQDEDSEEENASSFIDNHDKVLPTSITNKEM
jgi:hypothetical protein